jgi:hypothetical protein
MHGHDLKHRKTKAAQPARSTRTIQNKTEDVQEVQTRDQDRHNTTTTTDTAIAIENQTAPEVQQNEQDNTIESDFQDLLINITATRNRNLPRNLKPVLPPNNTKTPTTPTQIQIP